MTVYHGGLCAIPTPKIVKGDRIGDFGIGFYTTTDLEQARRFVRRKCGIAGVGRGVVSEYVIPDDALTSNTERSLSLLKFSGEMEVLCPEK